MVSKNVVKKAKRGRKPRGGKIIDAPPTPSSSGGYDPPVVLHLKCRISDLEGEQHDEEIPLPYEAETALGNFDVQVTDDSSSASPTLTEKLTIQSDNLDGGTLSDNESSCFWCTYPFEGSPVYIPKARTSHGLRGYGCFCSPECAAAHLFANKHLDNSTMHEQYFLLNNLYASQEPNAQPIRAAPNPHFLLSRFCGNLSIEEYRQLSRGDRVVMVVNEPLTRSLPEIHTHARHTLSCGRREAIGSLGSGVRTRRPSA